MNDARFKAGSAAVDVTPDGSPFLHGYPHAARNATGVNDPLLASALCLDDGRAAVLFIANDVIFVSKESTQRVRRRIEHETKIPGDHVLISASHTHSGPVTAEMLCSQHDPVVTPPDRKYLQKLEDGMVKAAVAAWRSRQPAEAGLALADGSGVGTNRRDPSGPADSQVPVLAVRQRDRGRWIALMCVCSMHPTVLHEDSTLISGDFPGLARRYLQQNVIGIDCPLVYHMGASGNQSPRHVTKGNTVAEAQRLGEILGKSIERALAQVEYRTDLSLNARHTQVDLPTRSFPSPVEAQRRLDESINCLEHLRRDGAPRTQVRTAECDWFGAEETLTLARAAQSGQFTEFAARSLPAEVQLIGVGPWKFVGWPGEVFVEFALDVKRRVPDSFIITCANGETQGYLVTAEAIEQRAYEAGNAMFKSPDSAQSLVDATVELTGTS